MPRTARPPRALLLVTLVVVTIVSAVHVGRHLDFSRPDTRGAPRPPNPGLPPVDVELRADLDQIAAEVDERFLSVAVDMAQVVGDEFWGPEGAQGVLGSAPVPVYDFARPRLRTLAAELAPAYLRIGGSDADRVFYDLSDEPVTFPPEGFASVLTAAQLEGIFDFARALDYRVVFTLNAGPGTRDALGAWQDATARELVAFVAERDHPVAVWELGNEWNAFVLIHGPRSILARLQMLTDFRKARALVDELHPTALLAGPSSAFWPRVGEPNAVFSGFVEDGGLDFLDIVTWHYYPQQSARCPLATRRAGPGTLLSPIHLAEVERWAAHVEERARERPVWLGETGNAQCGGQAGVSDRFVSSLWWADQLGRMARRGQQVVIRQTLSGSEYGLLDDTDLSPRPDYWTSLLWRRWMGERVLEVEVADDSQTLAYAHCTPGRDGALTLVVINLDPVLPRRVSLEEFAGRREVYLLSASHTLSRTAELNGEALVIEGDEIPPLEPRVLENGAPVHVPPTSLAFVVFPEARAAACIR